MRATCRDVALKLNIGPETLRNRVTLAHAGTCRPKYMKVTTTLTQTAR